MNRFWVGSQNGGGSESRSARVFEPGVGHYANGTKGPTGGCPYSSWILTGALRVAEAQGNFDLGVDLHGNDVGYGDMLDDMVEWWVKRSLQLRTDCIIANGGKTFGGDSACLDRAPVEGTPCVARFIFMYFYCIVQCIF